MNSTQSDYPPSSAASVSQQHDNASTNMQPMTISQTIQVVQDDPPNNDLSQPQENVVMAEYSFFYKPYNDFQVYHITCKEISIEIVFHHLSNYESYAQSNNLHVFYYQHPDDKRIYQVVCEMVSYTFIVCWLNKINYGIELNLNEQQQQNLDFSKELKENLEFHLKQSLTYYLPNEQLNMNHGQCNFIDNGIDSSDPTLGYTSQQHISDNNIYNQISTSQQDNSDQLITSQNAVEDYTQDHNNINIFQS